jgi:hypothetical protein
MTAPHTPDHPAAPSDMAQVMHSIGKLTGAVQAMHDGTTARIEDIRNDIRRLELATQGQLQQVETRLSKQIADQGAELNKRVDGLGSRVSNLEAEDKRLIEKTAKLGALGGGVGGALAAGAVELIKHFSK